MTSSEIKMSKTRVVKTVAKMVFVYLRGMTRTERPDRVRNQAWAKKRMSSFNLDPLKAVKSSDTIFILGSGQSINDLKEAHWEEIRRHDSFGFNFWILHPFAPSFFQFEGPYGDERISLFKREIKNRRLDYSQTQVLVKNPNIGHDEAEIRQTLPENLHFPKIAKIPCHYRSELDVFYRLVSKLRLWTSSKTLFTQCGSLSEITYLAFLLGYKKIVYLGVDLSSPGFFWQTGDHPHRAFTNGQIGTVHKTFDKSVDGLTIDDVLLSLNEQVLQPNGVEIYTGSAKSALFPRLPLYGWAEDTLGGEHETASKQ